MMGFICKSTEYKLISCMLLLERPCMLLRERPCMLLREQNVYANLKNT